MNDAAVAGYCRACGKALSESEIHRAHGAFYCQEHAPLDSAPSPGAGAASSGTSSFASSPYGSAPYGSAPYGSAPYGPYNPPPSSGISPAAAFWLGLIPGVGAIYNGQYAKGFVHVGVIALGISILNNDAAGGFEPLVGMMLAAFWVYMPFEAYHTARHRQAGRPVDELSGLVPTRGANFAIPAMLILLGTVLLLDNLQLFELRRVLRYWPMLLIGAGIYMLYTRYAISRSAASPDAAGNPDLRDPSLGNSNLGNSAK